MGSKAGSSSQKIPGYLRDFQERNIARGEGIADIGYLPYTGPEIAAVNPWEEAVNQGVIDQSAAFNMAAPEGTIASRMPETVGGEGGVPAGYSSYGTFQQAVNELQNVAPEFEQRYREQFNIPQGGNIYGDVGGVGSGQTGPVDTSGMSNAQLAQMALDSGMLNLSPQEQDIVRNQMIPSDAFQGGGLMEYNAAADPSVHPNHAARLTAIQDAVRRMQTQGLPAQGMGQFGSQFRGGTGPRETSSPDMTNEDVLRLMIGRGGLLGRT
jgi:hypothetical protein